MANKIGKYSTGLGKEPRSSPMQNCNEGWGGRSSLKKQYDTMEPRQQPKRTTTGAAPDPTQHRNMSRYSKK